MRSILPRIAAGGALLLSAASVMTMCKTAGNSGSLRVDAPGDGTFEIYRIASESPLQFVSEQMGRFNEELELAPGSYLILADCSSETIVVYPGSQKVLLAHTINFIPAHAPEAGDNFSIQCVRSEKTRSRQHISRRFSLNVLGGRREMLVGMLPFVVNLDDSKSSRILSYRLSAVRVEFPPQDEKSGKVQGPPTDVATAGTDRRQQDLPAAPVNDAREKFFVSPTNELVSITESQVFGNWQYLLPGTYHMEVNGTRLSVQLDEGLQQSITVGFLRVSTSPKVNLELSSQIRGSPLFVEINGDHWLALNQTYPVLPGTIAVSLNGSTRATQVELQSGESRELQARSVTVDMGCSPWEWTCLGNKSVHLYLPDQPYPFAEGVSDVPLLYLEERVLVGIEGSKDIRYTIPGNVRDAVLRVGYVEIVPVATTQKGLVTDLVRIEPTDASLAVGHTLDIPLDKPSRIPLVAGQYNLAQYVMSTIVDGDRNRSGQGLWISSGKTASRTVTVWLSEKRMAALKRAQEEENKARTRVGSSGSLGRHEPAVPIEML